MILLNYLRQTSDMGLTYRRNSNNDLCLHAYADSDYAGCKDTRRSRSGGVIMMCGNPILWISKMQATVALSSAEAEINALLSITKNIVYVVNLLDDLKIKPKGPIDVYEDNSGCIDIVTNPVINEKSKHMGVHYHYIKENIENNVIKVKKIASEWNLADIFTKPLPPVHFPRLRDLLFDSLYNDNRYKHANEDHVVMIALNNMTLKNEKINCVKSCNSDYRKKFRKNNSMSDDSMYC